ncbi:MAG: hypothetical protein ACI9MR_000595 [Myxococcota bacterium]|jgi:hypothetical protein
MTRVAPVITLLLFVATLSACPEEVTGPSPGLADPALGTSLPVDPGLVCRDQLTTDVVIIGERFSPVPFDIPNDPKAALPTVTMVRTLTLDGGAGDGAEQIWHGEPDGSNASRLSWQSQGQMTFVIDQTLDLADGTQGSISTGLYDVRVTNANGAEATSTSSLAVIAKPTLADVDPGITCLAEDSRTIGLSGASFLRLQGRDAELRVDDVASPFALSDFDACTVIAHPGLDAQICGAANVVLAQTSIPVGYPGLTIQNPETAACASEEDTRLRVVPPPSIAAFEPAMVCVAEGPRVVTLVGSDLLGIDGALPGVTLDGGALTVGPLADCQALETQGHDVQQCTSLSVTLPQEDTTAPRQPTIGIINPTPAGCGDTRNDALVLVPPPDVQDIQPPVICDDGAAQVLKLSGAFFFVVDGVKPGVTVDVTTLDPTAVALSDCVVLVVPGLTVEQCDTIDITVSPAAVDGDAATITVANPAPAGCSDIYEIDVPLIDPPVITRAQPAMVCTDDGDRSIVIEGQNFYTVAGVLPTVTLNGVAATVTSSGACVDAVIGPLSDVEICGELTVTASSGSLEPGPVAIVVTSAPPIPCTGAAADVLVVPPEVTITAVTPNAICSAAGDTTITITGDGFLNVEGTPPAVALASDDYAIVANSFTGCTDLDVPGMTVESCTGFDVLVPANAFADGDIPISVTNPSPSGCGRTATGVFFAVPVPDVVAVDPAAFCTDTGDTLTVTGSHFSPASKVFLTDTDGTDFAATVTFVSAAELSAEFAGGIPPGTYDLTVENAAGCADLLPLAVKIDPQPLVFFIDPPVVYSGITIQSTIYLTGLEEDAATVVLLGPSGQMEVLSGTSAPGQPNRIGAAIPAGLEAGSWDVQITSQLGCVGVLAGALTVTDDLSITIDDVDPSFVWQGSNTAITISSDAGDFIQTPRAYLNPKSAAQGTPATSVRAVIHDADTTLTGVVAGPLLQAGEVYELIVINPDGTVGIYDGITITAEPPPFIDAIVPASFDVNTAFSATITGENFDVDTVTMRCLVPDGAGFTLFPAADSPGLPVTVEAGATDTVVTATFPSDNGNLTVGSVCTVRLINLDGTSSRFSAVSLKNPSQNLNPWRDSGAAMLEARRGLGLVAGRPTNSSRFLYAIGGDDGTVAGAKTTAESVSVDVFGRLGSWQPQVNPLPAERTFGGTTRLGQFVYVAGGHDAVGAVATLYRAHILDPLATPEFADLDITVDEADGASGLGEGVWIYRVAATFPDGDSVNPGGESLPGEPIVVQLPAVAGLQVTIHWDAIPGADGYRVYRTAAAGAGVDTVALIDTVSGGDTTSLLDNGLAAGAATPLPPGSLGVWAAFGAGLTTARESHGVLAAPHPSTAGTFYLYVFGGRVPDGISAGVDSYLDSYEVAKVVVTAPTVAKGREDQTVAAFVEHTGQLSAARANLGAYLVTGADVADPGTTFGGARGEVWIFLGPGADANGGVSQLDAAVVGADGTLGYPGDDPAGAGDPPLMEPGSNPPAGFGYGAGVANGFLFIAGGGTSAASPDNRVRSAELCQGVGDCGGADLLPELRNWTPQGGGVLTAARIFLGLTQESAFFFSAGGVGPAAGGGLEVKSTVETTVQ